MTGLSAELSGTESNNLRTTITISAGSRIDNSGPRRKNLSVTLRRLTEASSSVDTCKDTI